MDMHCICLQSFGKISQIQFDLKENCDGELVIPYSFWAAWSMLMPQTAGVVWFPPPIRAGWSPLNSSMAEKDHFNYTNPLHCRVFSRC